MTASRAGAWPIPDALADVDRLDDNAPDVIPDAVFTSSARDVQEPVRDDTAQCPMDAGDNGGMEALGVEAGTGRQENRNANIPANVNPGTPTATPEPALQDHEDAAQQATGDAIPADRQYRQAQRDQALEPANAEAQRQTGLPGGKFILPRSIHAVLKHTHFDLALYVLILSNAVYKPMLEHAGRVLKRGQWYRSYSKLAEDLAHRRGNKKVTPSNAVIFRALRRLEQKSLIKCGVYRERTESEQRANGENSGTGTETGTLITVIGYAQMQDFAHSDRTRPERQAERQAERDRNGTGTRAERDRKETNKGETKIETNGETKEKMNTVHSPLSRPSGGSAPTAEPDVIATEFELLWQQYPKEARVGKASALKHYRSDRKAGATAQEIGAGMARYVRFTEHRRQTEFSGLTFKNADTFFTGQRWREPWEIPAPRDNRVNQI